MQAEPRLTISVKRRPPRTSVNGHPAGRGAPSGRAPLAHLPPKPLGEAGGNRQIGALRRRSHCARGGPPPASLRLVHPLPQAGEGINVTTVPGRAPGCALPFSLLHVVCGGGPGRGAPPRAPSHPKRREPSATTPPPKLGEGSPAVARNERKAGRGRGLPRSGPWGKTFPCRDPRRTAADSTQFVKTSRVRPALRQCNPSVRS
jgi:hypothetical protein